MNGKNGCIKIVGARLDMIGPIRFTIDDEMIEGFARLGSFQMFRKYGLIGIPAGLVGVALLLCLSWALYSLGCHEVFVVLFVFGAMFLFTLIVKRFVDAFKHIPPKWCSASARERIVARFWRALGILESASSLEGSECMVGLGQDSLSFSLGSFMREFDLADVAWVAVERDLMVICFDDGFRVLPRGWWLIVGGPVESHFKPVVPVHVGDLDELARASLVARLKEGARRARGDSACRPGASRCGAEQVLPSLETGEAAVSSFGFDAETLVRCEKMILAANGKEFAIWEIVFSLMWMVFPIMGLALFSPVFAALVERGRLVGLLGFNGAFIILLVVWLVLLMRDLMCGLGGLFPLRGGSSSRRVFMRQAVLSWLACEDSENPFLLPPMRGSLAETPNGRPPALLKWYRGMVSQPITPLFVVEADAFHWPIVRARRLPQGAACDAAPESVRFTAAFYPDRIVKGSHGVVFAESYSDVHDVVEDDRFPGLAILRHENGYSQLVVRTDLLAPGEWDEVKARIARSRVKRRRCSVWESDTGTIVVG